MAIAFVAASQASGPSLPLPAGAAAGHVHVVEATQIGGVYPITPAGYTQIAAASQSTSSRGVLAFRVLDGTETDGGTWTNSVRTVGSVYSGCKASGPIGAYAAAGYTTAAINVPALTCNVTDGTSWIALFCMHRGTGSPQPTGGFVGVTTRVLISAVNFALAGDLNGGVTSFAGASTATTNNNTNLGFAVELLAESSDSTGSASGSIDFASTAQGAALAQGAASGSLAITGAAQGAAPSAGQASGAIAFTGSSQGIAPAIGQASGVISFTSAAAGVSVVIGGAAGVIALTGAASGAANVNAAASGVLPLTGAAAGVTGSTAIGIASGTIDLFGVAAGLAPANGAAAGSLGLTGGSTGLAGVSAIGAAAGSISLTGAGAGVAPVVGAAIGGVALAGAGQGAVAARGIGGGVLSFSGASVGAAIIVGGASGTISLSGSARAGAVTPGAVAMFRVPAVWALHASTAEWREFEITGAWALRSIPAQWRAA